MRLVWQWVQVERSLPPNWTEIRVSVTVPTAQQDRAAALLGGANPLRRGDHLRLFVSRSGGYGPEAFRRALAVHPKLEKIPDIVKRLTEKVEGREI